MARTRTGGEPTAGSVPLLQPASCVPSHAMVHFAIDLRYQPTPMLSAERVLPEMATAGLPLFVESWMTNSSEPLGGPLVRFS